MTQNDIFLTTAQVAEVCVVDPSVVRKWIARGRISRAPDGRIDARALLRYLDERGHHGQHRDPEVDAGQRT